MQQHTRPHPEVDNHAPNGYSVHWQPIASNMPRATPLPLLRIAIATIGFSALSFAIGYWVNIARANVILDQAETTLTEAKRIKTATTGEIDGLREEVQQRDTRIKMANDCIYRAFQEPLPTTGATAP